MQSTWSVAKHDTIPLVELGLTPLESHAYLFAFLNAEGTEYTPPYTGVREELTRIITDADARKRQGQAPRADVTDQRLRTWEAVFESFGILRVDPLEKKLQLTPLGRAIKNVYSSIDDKLEGANDRLAMMAIKVLSRHRLRNPLNGSDYPEDSDVYPYKLVWKAMRRLDNKLHWEEVNRVLMHVLYQRDEDAAIEKIRDVRKTIVGGPYDEQSLKALGEPAVEEGNETQRRISPWFSQAGFGGYLISANTDSSGYRHLVERYIPLIDDAIESVDDLPEQAKVSADAYLQYITADPSGGPLQMPSAGKHTLEAIIDAARRFGGKKIICLAGIPGTGKTHLARLAGMNLADGDPYRFTEVQFHPGTSYEDFVEGFIPKPSGEGFELQPKVLRIMNRRARLDPDGKPYVLLIEEFTRADVQAVMGELLTYVEHRDRPFRFAISNQEDRLAPNLIVLTTMNPRDKTAATLDHAVLRRLYRVPVPSSVTQLHELLVGKLDDSLLERLEYWFAKFIDVLPFGHAEFSDVRSESDLRAIWSGTLEPFLLDVAGNVRDIYRDLEAAYPWRQHQGNDNGAAVA